MEDEKLVAMANQMAGFFAAYPDDVAVKGVADHVKAFWTPAMHRALIAHVAAGGGGVHPIVKRAMLASAAV